MLSIIILSGITVLFLIISLIADKRKTFNGLKKAWIMFINLLPPFITILIAVSVLLFFTPKEELVKWLGKESGAAGMLIAALAGSISLIPGFIAYPLAKILVDSGVSYQVIAIFITTLMMVGILTLPIEKKFFGLKAAIIRNLLSFAGAIIIGLTIGILWEIL